MDPKLCDHVKISDAWISRYCDSQLLRCHDGPAGSSTIRTTDEEVYGDPSHPIRFRIGNGGAGYTGILRSLAEAFIAGAGNDFRIGWVPNHSRHSQVALLADVVQVALTYEPENEDISIKEGWAHRVCRVFNDHFILAGPKVTLDSCRIDDAFRKIATSYREGSVTKPTSFLTRGDGSATFTKERQLWELAGVDLSHAQWIKTHPLTPHDALVQAERDHAFLLTDRATFLTAKRRGVIPSMRAHLEGGRELLNPCSALVQTAGIGSEDDGALESKASARMFAEWLRSQKAQEIITMYGRHWQEGKPLFTPAKQDDFSNFDRLEDPERHVAFRSHASKE